MNIARDYYPMKAHSIIACITLTLLLAACGGGPEMQKQSSSGALPQAQSAAKEILSGSNKGQYMKPGAPVQMSYTSEKVMVGQMSNIQAILHLTSSAVEQAKVDITSDEGIVLHRSPGASFPLNLTPGQLNYPLSFTASSAKIGLGYINILVTTSQNGRKQTRALAIPLQSGSTEQLKKLKSANSPVEYDTNNNPIISMQAEETVN